MLPLSAVPCTFSNIWAPFSGTFGLHLQQILVYDEGASNPHQLEIFLLVFFPQIWQPPWTTSSKVMANSMAPLDKELGKCLSFAGMGFNRVGDRCMLGSMVRCGRTNCMYFTTHIINSSNQTLLLFCLFFFDKPKIFII